MTAAVPHFCNTQVKRNYTACPIYCVTLHKNNKIKPEALPKTKKKLILVQFVVVYSN